MKQVERKVYSFTACMQDIRLNMMDVCSIEIVLSQGIQKRDFAFYSSKHNRFEISVLFHFRQLLKQEDALALLMRLALFLCFIDFCTRMPTALRPISNHSASL